MIALLPAVAVVHPIWMPEWLNRAMDMVGALFLAACCIGRTWCSAFIGGRKDQQLVTEGPYSIVRNPLYVFSFIGAIGIALLSNISTVLFGTMLLFVIYYRSVVAHEEALLAVKHGDKYARYLRTVPRWIPDFSLWRDPVVLVISPKILTVHACDSSVFLLALVLFECLEILDLYGAQLVLFRLP